MSRPRLIVLNVIVLFFNPDVAIALAFENRFCPPYFFLFPFSFFSIFSLFSVFFSPPPRPRSAPCCAGWGGQCRGSAALRRPHGAVPCTDTRTEPGQPLCLLLSPAALLGFGSKPPWLCPPPAASPRGDVSWWLCPAQWHDDPVRLCLYLCIPLELEEPFRLLALHQDQREAPAQPKPWVPSPPTAEGSWYNGVFVLWTSAPNARPSGCDPRAAPTPLAPR